MTTFKTMVGLKRRLGFQTSKEDICLQPSGSEMRTAMEHTVLQMLKEQGWYILEKDMFLSVPLPSFVPSCLYCCAMKQASLFGLKPTQLMTDGIHVSESTGTPVWGCMNVI